MTKSYKTLILACLLAPLWVAAQERLLMPKDVKEMWVGKTVSGTTPNGAKVVFKLNDDFSATVQAGTLADKGTWRVTEEKFCATWEKIRTGQERCFIGVINGSATKLFNPDGTLAGTYTDIK